MGFGSQTGSGNSKPRNSPPARDSSSVIAQLFLPMRATALPASEQPPHHPTSPRFAPIKRKDGTVTGHLELFYVAAADRWVSVPGVSRWMRADGVIEEVASD